MPGGAAASAGGVFAGDWFPCAPRTAVVANPATTNTPNHCLFINASLYFDNRRSFSNSGTNWEACHQIPNSKTRNPSPKRKIPTHTGVPLGVGSWDLGFGVWDLWDATGNSYPTI